MDSFLPKFLCALFAVGALAGSPVAAEVTCDGKVQNLFVEIEERALNHVALTVPQGKEFLLTQVCSNLGDDDSSDLDSGDFDFDVPGDDGNILRIPDLRRGACKEYVPGIRYPGGTEVVVQSPQLGQSVILNGCLVGHRPKFPRFKF